MIRFIAAGTLAILMSTATFVQAQPAERNKEIVRKIFTDMLSQGKFEVASEIFAKNFTNHTVTKDVALDAYLAENRGWRTAFPDLEMIVEKEIAEGDFVTVLWKGTGTNTGAGNGLNATGKKAEGRGISIFRLANGKIVEEWTEYSQLLILQQLGLAPKPN